jgi:hypothetical protein
MRLRSRKFVFGLAVLLVAAALPLGLYWWQSSQAKYDVTAIVADLDRAGEPWRLADLEAGRKLIADESNAAIVLRKAKVPNLWKRFPGLEDFDRPPWQQLPPEMWMKLREGFEASEENLVEARRLVEFTEGGYYVTIRPDAISTLIPYVQDVREVAILLKIDACWQIQQGDFDQAAQSCRAAIIAARTLEGELFLISHLVRLAMLREIAGTLERMVAQGEPSPKLLPPLRELLLREADVDGWTRAMRGERASMNQLFQYLESGEGSPRNVRAVMGGRVTWQDVVSDYFGTASVPQSHAWMLRLYTDLLAARDLPPPERQARFDELDCSIEQAPALAKSLLTSQWRSREPVYAPVFDRTKVRLRSAAAGLAAEQFRQEQKRWPKSLEELTPKYLPNVPVDPFTGEPLKFRATDDGIVIYSPGANGDLNGSIRDDPQAAQYDPRFEHEFRLWNVDRRRRPAEAKP